ncbi:MAG: sulfatase [Ardenticatenia bacterium]|nr:sulfatase [Ardenticatenia bacterium]
MMQRPNILLIILDATRYDYCSCYGFDKLTTPALDQLAAEGTLYEYAISPAPWTLPAFASLFTGLFPSQTGIYATRHLDPRFETLARILGSHGYSTFIITSNSWLSTGFGLVRDFMTVHKLWQLWQASEDVIVQHDRPKLNMYLSAIKKHILKLDAPRNIVNYLYHRATQRIDAGASRTLRPLMKWITAQQGPWFAVVHFMEAHLPYRPPLKWLHRFARQPRLAKQLRGADQQRLFWRHNAGVELLSHEELAAWRDLYAAELAYQDFYLGQLLEWLSRQRMRDSTCIVVGGDHGENLGEHELLNHQYCLYETLIRVPLVISYPPLFEPGKRVQHLVSTLDIFPTILRVAGVDIPPSAEDYHLLSDSPVRPYVISEYGKPSVPPVTVLAKFGLKPEHFKRFVRGLTSLRTERYKVIVGTDGSKELYDLEIDPQETDNLIDKRPEIAQQLLSLLHVWWQEHDVGPVDQAGSLTGKVHSSVVERLQALGYLD